MLLYIIYGILVVLCIASSVLFIKIKQRAIAVAIILPTVFSLLFFWLFADANDYWTQVCDESNGCMNETGMFVVIALFFIGIATLVTLIALSIWSYSKFNKKEISA